VFGLSDPEQNDVNFARFLSGLDILHIDVETCRIFGRERARLRAARTMIGDFDPLIGATAL